MQTEFTTYHPLHLAHVLADLRPADRVELEAAHGPGFVDDVATGVGMATHRWTMMIGGKVAAVFGATPLKANVLPSIRVGAPWLIGASILGGRGGRLVRGMPVYIQQLLQSYDLLTNFVDINNTQARTWLRHMGFSFREVLPYGPDSSLFQRFEMWRPPCAPLV